MLGLQVATQIPGCKSGDRAFARGIATGQWRPRIPLGYSVADVVSPLAALVPAVVHDHAGGVAGEDNQ